MNEYKSIVMEQSGATDDYEIYSCTFALENADLYFYYFHITTKNEAFSLYREGYDRTNMEAGELWQLSCIPSNFSVPKDYSGAIMYQIFPDRFNQLGVCDPSGKLEPFWIHSDKRDIPCYLANENGEVQNCDFYGGNLMGIASKLDYLKELGVHAIYLNPIFKAWSNHRYDTADYHKIDELLGTEEDFSKLCELAHEREIKIILDGVFSHTGSNSIYFDKLGIFGNGAYSCPDSPYRSWYDFKEYPHIYTSWWGIDTLPCVNEMNEDFRNFIIDAEDSVIAHWLRAGADGFRLDVADELPDEFIAAFRERLKSIKPDALLVGEVWEDASNKISYNKRRRYFVNGELDSVMNYPFRKCIIDYVLNNDNGTRFKETVMTIAENYPKNVLHTLMNMLSTHDTPRILSVLSKENNPCDMKDRAGYTMSESARDNALLRLRVATFLQFILPGMPCIYYGDEIGSEGLGDPFNRGYFLWDRVEGNSLREFFVRIANIRNSNETLKHGAVSVECDGMGRVIIERKSETNICRAYVNMGETVKLEISGNLLLFESGYIDNGEFTLNNCGFMLEEFTIQ
jgi:glycosidase